MLEFLKKYIHFWRRKGNYRICRWCGCYQVRTSLMDNCEPHWYDMGQADDWLRSFLK